MRPTAKLSKILCAFALIFVAVALSGCGASLTVYDYTSDGVRYNEYALSLERPLVDRMEQSAAEVGGTKYTVPEYFYELFGMYGYELVSATLTDKGYDALYRKKFASATAATELYTVGTSPDFTYEYSDGPFVRDITATADNPFNGVRAAYDAVEPGKSGRLIQQLKNGVVSREYGEEIVLFPAVQDAFPYLRGVDLDGLLLNYVMNGSSRMNSSGSNIDGSGAFVFSRYFDDSDATLEFTYKRPMPYGWYLTAFLVGVLTVVAIWLATRPKKDKPTLLDRFPYNPEEFRDYDSHLPRQL